MRDLQTLCNLYTEEISWAFFYAKLTGVTCPSRKETGPPQSISYWRSSKGLKHLTQINREIKWNTFESKGRILATSFSVCFGATCRPSDTLVPRSPLMYYLLWFPGSKREFFIVHYFSFYFTLIFILPDVSSRQW